MSELPTLTPTKAEAGVRAANKAAIVANAAAMVTSNLCSLHKISKVSAACPWIYAIVALLCPPPRNAKHAAITPRRLAPRT